MITLAIQTIGTDAVQTVNARDLHTFLGVPTQFSHWIRRRIKSYGFTEGSDFAVVAIANGINQRHTTSIGDPIEYHVSLDMAKELAMVDKTKKGREARRYFIACEKQAKQLVSNPNSRELEAISQQIALLTQHIEAVCAQRTIEPSPCAVETAYWLSDYFHRYKTKHGDFETVRKGKAFQDEGFAYLCLPLFLTYVRLTWRGSIHMLELEGRLQVLGWDKTEVTRTSPGGEAFHTKAYWRRTLHQ